ncbi:MAG: GntR domain protein [Frankiales bacterium]|nr:GntR domain protein [Frankiales bacterium]
MPVTDVDGAVGPDGAVVPADDGAGEAGSGKLAAQVARRIEAEVIRRGWPVGASLGSEPELRERYGVSRSVLREAVRLVEHHQVARMRRGPNGGLFVVEPDAGPAARAMVIYLEFLGTSVEHLLDARRLLEPLAAGLAAQRVTEDGIHRLRRAVDDAVQQAGGPRPDSLESLHVLLGELSANPVLRLFIDVLTRLTNLYGTQASGAPRAVYRQARADAQTRHAEIADAVTAGDVGRAESLLLAYLDEVADWMRNHPRARRFTSVPAGTTTARPEPQAKLAEVVAARLRRDIAAADWPVGSVVGSESELLARYGISRAALREAVRLLEEHSVARMRRGPGGGLVVATPDPRASIDTMALRLEYQGVTGGDLLAVREAIEIGVVSRVTAHYRDPAVRDRLERSIRRVGEGSGEDQIRADHFHTELADLSGNPVLVLFLRILTELWHRHYAREQTEIGPDVQAQAASVHHRILEAVTTGDEGLARHRMRRHLAALTEWWH